VSDANNMSNATLIKWNDAKQNAEFLRIRSDGSFEIQGGAPTLFVLGQLVHAFLKQQDRIKRLEESHSWHPIETAPHDYNWVLGYDANDGETGMIIFDRAYNSLDDDGRECHWTDGIREWTPTHWMPLPDEPKAKEAKP
jgi:hypothetical protein